MAIAMPGRNRKIRVEDKEERFVLQACNLQISSPFKSSIVDALPHIRRHVLFTYFQEPEHPPFPFRTPPHTIRTELQPSRKIMPLSGEAIRLMNYIDDVAVTLRRVLATVPTLSAEERARVAEHLQGAKPSADDVAKALALK